MIQSILAIIFWPFGEICTPYDKKMTKGGRTCTTKVAFTTCSQKQTNNCTYNKNVSIANFWLILFPYLQHRCQKLFQEFWQHCKKFHISLQIKFCNGVRWVTLSPFSFLSNNVCKKVFYSKQIILLSFSKSQYYDNFYNFIFRHF